ncbi:hypothetical protein LguiB_004273 [Lonicera macranthoides]
MSQQRRLCAMEYDELITSLQTYPNAFPRTMKRPGRLIRLAYTIEVDLDMAMMLVGEICKPYLDLERNKTPVGSTPPPPPPLHQISFSLLAMRLKFRPPSSAPKNTDSKSV